MRWRDGNFKRLTRKDGLAFQNDEVRDRVRLVHSNRLGGVWAATVGFSWVRENSIRNFGHPQGLVNYAFHSLLDAADGTFWTGGTVLHRFDEQTGRFTADPNTQTLGLIIRGIQDDGAGGFGCSVTTITAALGFITTAAVIWKLRGTKSPGFRRNFLEADRDGHLWIAVDGELHRFHNGELTRYLFAGFTFARIRDVFPGGSAMAIIGSARKRAACIAGSPRPSRRSHRATGSHTTTPGTICEARDGSVWIGTENGLSQFKDGRFRTFTKTNGLSGCIKSAPWPRTRRAVVSGSARAAACR